MTTAASTTIIDAGLRLGPWKGRGVPRTSSTAPRSSYSSVPHFGATSASRRRSAQCRPRWGPHQPSSRSLGFLGTPKGITRPLLGAPTPVRNPPRPASPRRGRGFQRACVRPSQSRPRSPHLAAGRVQEARVCPAQSTSSGCRGDLEAVRLLAVVYDRAFREKRPRARACLERLCAHPTPRTPTSSTSSARPCSRPGSTPRPRRPSRRSIALRPTEPLPYWGLARTPPGPFRISRGAPDRRVGARWARPPDHHRLVRRAPARRWRRLAGFPRRSKSRGRGLAPW